jgi:hypothetical protein
MGKVVRSLGEVERLAFAEIEHVIFP